MTCIDRLRGNHLAKSLVIFLVLATRPSVALSGMEDELFPWEDLEEEVEQIVQNEEHCSLEQSQCWYNGTERSPLEGSPTHLHGLSSHCYCDEECIHYGDCCLDKAKTEWEDGKVAEKAKYNCRMLEAQSLVGVLMVDSCLPSWEGHRVQKLCHPELMMPNYSYILDVPVTSRATNITYPNYYCALCNNDTLDLHEWTFNIVCNNKEVTLEYNMTEFLSEAIYTPGRRVWLRPGVLRKEDGSLVRTRHLCSPKIKELQDIEAFARDYGTRLCIFPKVESVKRLIGRRYFEQVRQCHPDWPDHSDVEKCKRYSLMVKYRDPMDKVTYFKNPHCAKCNFVNISEGDMQCFATEDSKRIVNSIKSWKLREVKLPLCFSVLMDFRGHGCDQAAELWDPINEQCQQIECGRLFRLVHGRCERDPEAYTLLANSTLLEVACPTRLLNVTEYVPLNNGSVFVNESKKVLKRGEFEATNDSGILVCVDPSHYADGAFSKAHQYLTLVVLSVSLAALGLHIAIFMLVPRHRNLPGKNLFSLSCCLFVAHVLFLMGTQQTDTYGLCVFLSCSLHYSWLAAFCWMNVMSVDVCRTFTSHVYRGDADGASTFFLYSLYAWTTPAVVVALALALDFGDILPDYRPEYATRTCWINNRNGLALFFLLPVGAIVQENIVLFCISAFGIYKQVKAARYANTRSQSVKEGHNDRKKSNAQKDVFSKQSVQNRRAKKERVRFVLYVKLGLIQGLTWVAGFIAAFANTPACWIVFTIFNGLQGAFIFIGFDMKKKVMESVWEALTGRPWAKKSSSKDTRTTTAGHSSHSHNRSSKSYRPKYFLLDVILRAAYNHINLFLKSLKKTKSHMATFDSPVHPYSDSDGEALEASMSHLTLIHDNVTWAHNGRLTPPDRVAYKTSPAASKTRKTSSGPSARNSLQSVQKSKLGRSSPTEVKSGDPGIGINRDRFHDDSANQPVVRRRPKSASEDDDVTARPVLPKHEQSEVGRDVDLLQQQQTEEAKPSLVDLPDLVQQLLLCSATNTCSPKPRKLSKCRSFTEGADPGMQEDRHSALAAKLQLLEYSKEWPTIHSLISNHLQRHMEDDSENTGEPPLSDAPEALRFCPSSLNGVNIDTRQLFNKPLEASKSLSYYQISQVALATAVLQRASSDARENKQNKSLRPQTEISKAAESLV